MFHRPDRRWLALAQGARQRGTYSGSKRSRSVAQQDSRQRLGRHAPWLVVVGVLSAALSGALALVAANDTPAQPAGSARQLSARQAALAPRLAGQLPVIESSEGPQQARGDVYAVLPQAWPTLVAALREPSQWCEALVLHIYVKRCMPGTAMLTLHVVSRADTPIEQAQLLTLNFSAGQSEPGHVQVRLAAAQGPLGLHHVELLFEAIPAGPSASFVHFRYESGFTALGSWAMQAYLATRGRDKVGFSAAAGDQQPGTIRGTRGVVERNAMRYHLALATYLDSLALPETTRPAYRTAAWFDATERYARQLHEVGRDDYLAMKRRELSTVAP
jgi:hypothetical protein